MSQQLVKKGTNGKHENVMPRSWIEAIKDKNTGQSLLEILQGFNMYFLSYNGDIEETRNMVPTNLRKKGLWITYVKYDGNVYTEWYASSKIDDKSWGDSSNWRIGNNTLVGDITISANGNWVINGTETEFKAVGEKGNTPLIRVANNRLQVSYDLGDTYMNVTENPVYTQFRWYAESENIGRIQASTDNGTTWTNMSNDFTNNLHISKYIGVNESLPISGIAEGTIYAKGPYYAEDDTLNDNPIYRLWVYAWKGNTLAWQDNGEFQSIAAGIVQETGDNENVVMSQKAVTEKLSKLSLEVNNNSNNIEGLNSSFQERNGETLFICDRKGNVVAEINERGISSVGFYENGRRVVSGSEDIVDRFSGEFYITDKAGNVILGVNESGLMTIGLNTNNMKKNSWGGKIVATYGDSVTALNGGDFVSPYGDDATKSKWAGKVAKYFDFAKIHNRGIGSTTFKYYNENGGQLAWCKTDTGEYVSRNDSYNYDNYQGNVTIPSNCTAIRGSGSSWLRIKTMFPESIKDTIDAVFIQYHNDFHQDMDTDCKWVEGSSYDPEWAASEYYETYGGDYNIQTVKGGIASTIMKFQAWMPNALIVLMTPISGVYINGNEEVKEIENVESAKMRKLAEVVKEISFKMSIPCIDVYGNDGINTLNHKLDGYITDGIHPYSDAGCNKIARAIISGLESIIPNIN